jgi:hypothetical protein
MFVFPLAAAGVSLAFAGLLGKQFLTRRRPYQAIWAVALLMYAAASFALFLGVRGGWSTADYRVYWLFGAVLNVPYLALGESYLLFRSRGVTTPILLVVLFATAFAASRIRTASIVLAPLTENLPQGKEVWARDTFALDLARFYAFPTYFLLVAGTLWSAWRMRGAPELRDRFFGTLGVAVGATVVAAGSAFALTGNFVGFSITLSVGIAVMFSGFVRASRPGAPRPPAAT